MINECQTVDTLLQEIKQLRRELAEANSIIDAIRHGEIDALLVSKEVGDQVYILKGADHIYRVLVEEMQEGCVTIDSDGVILFCNKDFADMTKISLDQLIGSSIYRLLNLQDRANFSSFLVEGKGSFKMECKLKAGHAFSMPVILSASCISVDDDVLTCLVVTDLTEQKRNERFIQMIFNQAKEPVIACDRYGYITQSNPAANTMFEGPLVGNYFDEVIPLHRTADGTRLELSQAIKSESSYGIEVQYTRNEEKPLTLLINAGKLNAEDEENVVGCVVVLTDITDKCMIADELARLDRLNTIGEVAAGLGHEVRNPLTTVRGYLQLFNRKAKYAEDREQIAIMIDELDRANSIITEFLSLAKNKSIDLKPGNLNCTIKALFPLLQAEAFRLGHEMITDLGDIHAVPYDEKELRQLILNLVRNGLEAMDSGGIVTISTYVEKGEVVLAVQGTGVGIPEEVCKKLGTPFITTKEGGTGLGLSICYRIAERHDAKIEVQSSSSGTTFYIRIKSTW